MSRGLSHRLRVGFERSGSAMRKVWLAGTLLSRICRHQPIGLPYASRCWIARSGANDDAWPLWTAAGVNVISQGDLMVFLELTHRALLLALPIAGLPLSLSLVFVISFLCCFREDRPCQHYQNSYGTCHCVNWKTTWISVVDRVSAAATGIAVAAGQSE